LITPWCQTKFEDKFERECYIETYVEMVPLYESVNGMIVLLPDYNDRVFKLFFSITTPCFKVIFLDYDALFFKLFFSITTPYF